MRVDYCSVALSQLRAPPPTAQPRTEGVPTSLELEGERLLPTARFWSSFYREFEMAPETFNYFTHEEVFSRLVEKRPNERVRLSVERREGKPPRLLAVSNPHHPLLGYAAAVDLIREHGGTDISYDEGVVTSWHTPRSGELPFQIGPDQFANRYTMESPVDGLGDPRLFLALLRQICTNGAVAYTLAFRSDLRVGQDVEHTVRRALAQFDHGQGFAALRQRFESAQTSWASVNEALKLRKVLTGVPDKTDGLVARLDRTAGDVRGLYGLANLDTLSVKRQRVLPTQCRVYDLLNFASEVATHHAPMSHRRRLQAYIGSMVASEYDLEGTAGKVPEFADLFAGVN